MGINLRPSYVMPTHGYYNGWNPSGQPIRLGGTADLQLVFSGSKRGVYHGAGAALHTFFSHELVGTPATLYVFQGAPLVRLTDRLALGYEWNLGVSSGWKANGDVINSPMNVYINVAALFTWRISRKCDIVFGPEYTHFSNGDTSFPNGGANTINFRAGIRGRIRPEENLLVENIFAKDEVHTQVRKRFSYDVTLLGGWRADRLISGSKLYIFNEAFPVAGACFNTLYRFNSYLSVGPALDLMYDRSANLLVSCDEGDKVTYRFPSFMQQSCVGFSARAELKMPVFAVNIGIGYSFQLGNHTRYESDDLTALYGIFALKAFVSDRLFLNVSYRLSSVLYSHNLLFGLGWRFGSI